MQFINLTTDVFKMKECPKYTKYAFACTYDGFLYFSNQHPEILCIPGVEFGWIPSKKSKFKKCDKFKIKNDYIERLVLCKNGRNFDSHEKQIEKMRQMDIC